jgi:radical SAM superfamily enzyme YgiQ (UPF0313 family)
MSDDFHILLISAPSNRLQFNLSDLYPLPKLGLACLCASLKKQGFLNTKILDPAGEHLSIRTLVKRITVPDPPHLLGISTTLLGLEQAVSIARAAKREHPDTRVVVGGPGVGFSPAPLFRFGAPVDFFVRGEGEKPIVELAKRLESGGRDFTGVPGLIWCDDSGTPRENEPPPYQCLDDLEFDFEALPMNRYRLHPPMGVYPPSAIMETARGCSFRCEFCCLSLPVRFRSPENVEREARFLKTRFGIREIHFVDPTFTLDRPRTEEICDRLREVGMHWSCKTRTDQVPPGLLQRMKQAGCYLISFGVESAAPECLDALNKNARPDSSVEAFRRCRELGIRTTAYLLVAAPGETEQDVEKTIRWVRFLDPDYVLYNLLLPDPSNPLTRKHIDEGRFDEEELCRYYFSGETTCFHRRTLSGIDLDTARNRLVRASRAFYCRPGYALSRIAALRTFADAKNLFAGGAAFFSDLLRLGRLWRW